MALRGRTSPSRGWTQGIESRASEPEMTSIMAVTTWGQRIRTGLGVTLVTVLVWLYAEAQAVVEMGEYIQVTFVPSAGQELVIQPEGPQIDPEAPQVFARLRGSTRQLDQLRRLRETGPIALEVPPRAEGGPRQENIIVRDALLRSALGELGLNIVEASPPTITLHIEPLTAESMPVRLVAEDLHLASPPRLEPDTVEVTMPQRLAEEASVLNATARLHEFDLSGLEVDVEHTVSVPVQLPEAIISPWTRVEPERVQVTFTIREQTGTIVKERIRIDLLHSPVLLREYDFDVRDQDLNLLDVELTGPVDVLEQIQEGEIPVTAWVSPSFEVLEEQVGDEPTDVELPVRVNVPPDVSVTSPLPDVPVTVTRRD